MINSASSSSLFNKIQIFLILLISFLMPMHIWIPELSLFCFLFWLLQGNWKSRFSSFDWKKNKVILFLLWGYFLYIAISTLFFGSFKLQFSELERRWALLIYPLFFIGTPQLKNNRKLIESILIFYVLGSLFISIYSLAIGNFSCFMPSKFLGNRIRFSNIIVLALAFSIYLSYRYKTQKKVLILLALAQAIYLFSIYTASSRSGIVAVAGLGILLLIFALHNKSLQLGNKIVLFIVVFATIYLLTTNDRMKKEIAHSPRSRIYKAALYSAKNGFEGFNYFVGFGKKRALIEFTDNLKRIGERLYDHPHNDFLSILLKRGFIGLFFFVSILGLAWYRGLKNRDFLILSFLFVFLVYHLFNGVFELRHDIYLFYYFYCLLIFYSDSCRNNSGIKEA